MQRLQMKTVLAFGAVLAFGFAPGAAQAQQSSASQHEAPLPPNVAAEMPFNIPYGKPIALSTARHIVDAALAESSRRHWKEACAIVEGNGQLVLFEKQDDTQYGSIEVALDKAKSAALYRRPTTLFNEATEHGHPYVMMLTGSTAVPGGMPIVAGGHLIGGLGCSGGTGGQDIVVADAGMKALGEKH